MTDNGPGETPDRNQSSGRYTPTQLDPDQDHVSLAEVIAVQEGDAIAVRAVQESGQNILAGRVTSAPDDTESPETIENSLNDNTSTTLLSIDTGTWWTLSEEETTNRTQELQDRPPMQEYIDSPPKDAPPCTLDYWETDHVILIIPMPVSNLSRVLYYTHDLSGTLVGLTHGPIVQPEELLPDGYEPPDS